MAVPRHSLATVRLLASLSSKRVKWEGCEKVARSWVMIEDCDAAFKILDTRDTGNINEACRFGPPYARLEQRSD